MVEGRTRRAEETKKGFIQDDQEGTNSLEREERPHQIPGAGKFNRRNNKTKKALLRRITYLAIICTSFIAITCGKAAVNVLNKNDCHVSC